MEQSFFEIQVGQMIGDYLQAQKGGPFLVLFEKAVFPIGAKGMTAMIQTLQHGLQLALKMAAHAVAEDLRGVISGETAQAEFAATLEDMPDGPVAFEDKVGAVFDLLDGPGAAQSPTSTPFLFGELGPQHKGPFV